MAGLHDLLAAHVLAGTAADWLAFGRMLLAGGAGPGGQRLRPPSRCG